MESSIPVSPSYAQDTHRSMHTLKIPQRMWHENAQITHNHSSRRIKTIIAATLYGDDDDDDDDGNNK